MKYFTYKDYIKCIHTLRLNSIMKLAEAIEIYNIDKNDETYLYQKLITNVLKNKKHLAEFLNEYLKSDIKVGEENLRPYTNEYIDKKVKSNIIYKLTNTDIFFVIQCAGKSNNRVIYTLLDNCIDIMRKYCQTRKEAELLRLPVIVPIIIYVGEEKWDIYDKDDSKYKSEYRTYELNNIDLKYNLYDYSMLKNKNNLDDKNILVNNIMEFRNSNLSQNFIKEIQESSFDKILYKDGIVGEVQELVIKNIMKRLKENNQIKNYRKNNI